MTALGPDAAEDALRDAASTEHRAAWRRLATDYESHRGREDSLDWLVEWPAQRKMLGDVVGRSFLDLGCGNGSKLIELMADGAADSAGIDIAGRFRTTTPGLRLVPGDLNDLGSIAELAGRKFDGIMFLQSFGYASDPVRTLQAAQAMLTRDGFILLTRTQPVRYALERAEANGTALGEEYFATATTFDYRSAWNDQVTLTKRPFTMSDLLNAFSAAGLWIEATIEPHLSEEDGARFPHKREWMNKYLGILMFKLRPLRNFEP